MARRLKGQATAAVCPSISRRWGRGTPSKEDLALSDMISTYDINFAKTGDPKARIAGVACVHRQEPAGDGVRCRAERAPYPLLQQVKVLDTYFERARIR